MSSTTRGPQLTDDQRDAFAATLRELRAKRNLTLDALAAAAGLTKAAVHQYEQGRYIPSLGTIAALAVALKSKPSALVAAIDPQKTFPKSV